MKKPLVSVLILTFNRSDLLKTCLDSVLKSNYPNLEFVVSDNGSEEDISNFIKKTFPGRKIKVVRLRRNRGLTGGFNYGLKFCRGKYVFVLSNDTRVDKNAISVMTEVMESDGQVGIVSPKIIQMRQPKLLHNAGSFLTLSGLLYHYGVLQNKDNVNYQKSYYIFSCNGAGFLIRRDVTKVTGLFDEDFFYFYDDSDLSHRVWLAGYTVVYQPKAYLWHLWSATMQGANPRIWYYNHRNHISSFIRNFSLPYMILLLFTFNLSLILWCLINLLKLQFSVSLSLLKAYIWHLAHIRETMKRRRHVQSKVRRVSDSLIFQKCLITPDWRYYFFYFNREYQDIPLPERVLYKNR